MFTRDLNNPLISPRDVRPSRPNVEVIGTFNAGAAAFGDETLLLIRVAERPISPAPDVLLCPYLDADGEMALVTIRRDDPDYDTHDSRLVIDRRSGDLWLTSISHLRLARSSDGLHFSVADRPWLQAQPPYESFGVEDARITQIDGRYYVNYSAVSRFGIATALVSTEDFVSVRRHGLIFAPNNRDVVLFPERIGGQYVCYHRPMPGARLNIWLATSPDLIHWGDLQVVLQGEAGGRVGGGAPPIRTERGWLSIYHTADQQQRYSLSAFLTALDAPQRIIARSREPILTPQAAYETEGFFGNVVFTCGALVQGDRLRLYYGAADERIALAEASLAELLASLEAV